MDAESISFMNFLFFLKKSFYLLGLMAIFSLAMLTKGFLSGYHNSIFTGFIIATLNFWGGVAIISWGFEKSEKEFFTAFIGGMFVRFALMFAAIFASLKIFNLDQVALIVTLIVSYFLYIAIEIWGILKISALRGY